MVGVANSAGCTTCRSRKVKCDLQRPSCGKCTKAGRDCGGYKRDRVFIIGTQRDQGRCSSHPKRGPLIPRSSKKRNQEVRRADSENSSMSTHLRSCQSPSYTSFASNNDTSLPRHSSCSPRPLVQPASANLQQLIAQNAEDFLMPPMFEVDPKSNVPSLLHFLHLMAEENMLFNRGIQAFCLAAAGKKHEDIRLNKASLKMSVEAVQEMQTILRNPSQAHCIEVVAATICMSDCEIMLSQAHSESDLQYCNWRGLILGTAALVQERGPLSFSQSPDFQLFTRQFRGSGILEAIGRRQHTYLAGADWRTLPWSRGFAKTMLDSCFDIMADMAGVLADVDMALGISSHEPRVGILGCSCETDAKSLLIRLFELETAWTIWFGELQKESHSLCQIVAAPDDVSPIFPLEIRFPSFRIGMLQMYMWASLVLIYDAIEALQSFLGQQQQQHALYHNIHTPPITPPKPSFFSSTPSQRNKKTNDNLRIFSHNIIQSLNPLLSTALAESWSVAHMLVFPLWIVMQCYRGRSDDEEGFLRRFMQRMMDEGISFAEALCTMTFREYATG